MEKYIEKLETQNNAFEEAMNRTSLAINSITSSIGHLTDLAERNILLNNARLDKMDKKHQEYDEGIKHFYQEGLIRAIDDRLKMMK